jgi:hypothetical protein
MKLQSIPKQALLPALVAAVSALVTVNANATVELGNPYTPAGADYTITAKQGVNSTNGSGGTSTGAQVNQDFEFKGTLGVSYSPTNNGKFTDFGVGIYNNGGTFSSGLNITYHQPAVASTASVTLADFDIQSNATFFNPQKVEASVLVYSGANTFSFNPTQVFAALQNTTGPNGNEDYWNLNFGTLLSNSGQSSNTPITGFLLYADSTNGEKVGSDPYFITSIGGFTPVPEPSTYVGGLALIGLVIAAHLKGGLKRRSQTA